MHSLLRNTSITFSLKISTYSFLGVRYALPIIYFDLSIRRQLRKNQINEFFSYPTMVLPWIMKYLSNLPQHQVYYRHPHELEIQKAHIFLWCIFYLMRKTRTKRHISDFSMHASIVSYLILCDTIERTCWKSPPRITIFPPNGKSVLVMFSNDRSKASNTWQWSLLFTQIKTMAHLNDYAKSLSLLSKHLDDEST